MKKARNQSILIDFVRIILGMIFLYASLDKIFAPASFAAVIYHYKILPFFLLNLCAIVIPWIEFGIGVLLLLDYWSDVALVLLNGLTIVFMILIAIAMARGLNIECGCFSLDSHNSYVGWKRLIEDFFILLAGLYLLFGYYYKNIH